MTTPVNHYAAPAALTGDYVYSGPSAPNYRYAESEHADHAYLDDPGGGWSPDVTGGNSSDDIPDPRRLQRMPLYQYRPPAMNPPERWWNGPRGPGQEGLERHRAVETVDGDGWEMTRGDATRKRAAPDVYRTPPPEPRPTNKMAPTTYSYTRPFDQTVERRMNGQHFSMADHKRDYEIYGMAPVRTSRNTYRLDPQPWDTNIVDMAPAYTPTEARIVSVDVPDAAGRSWRL